MYGCQFYAVRQRLALYIGKSESITGPLVLLEYTRLTKRYYQGYMIGTGMSPYVVAPPLISKNEVVYSTGALS